uniref:Structural constituent of ribosome protein n=1 Tax=Rhizophora mucronata TaxID=61149 RepID=A0A2P2KV75_RHIMU
MISSFSSSNCSSSEPKRKILIIVDEQVQGKTQILQDNDPLNTVLKGNFTLEGVAWLTI